MKKAASLHREAAFCHTCLYQIKRLGCTCGHILQKEVTPMKHFFRDVLAALVAAVLAALVIRFLNL